MIHWKVSRIVVHLCGNNNNLNKYFRINWNEKCEIYTVENVPDNWSIFMCFSDGIVLPKGILSRGVIKQFWVDESPLEISEEKTQKSPRIWWDKCWCKWAYYYLVCPVEWTQHEQKILTCKYALALNPLLYTALLLPIVWPLGSQQQPIFQTPFYFPGLCSIEYDKEIDFVVMNMKFSDQNGKVKNLDSSDNFDINNG